MLGEGRKFHIPDKSQPSHGVLPSSGPLSGLRNGSITEQRLPVMSPYFQRFCRNRSLAHGV